jgi:hypothetical protein
VSVQAGLFPPERGCTICCSQPPNEKLKRI